MMLDDKYVVFKRDDYDRFLNSLIKGHSVMAAPIPAATWSWSAAGIRPQPIEDAVVIRRQDVFAPPALDAYANNIYSATEILRMWDTDADVVKQLQSIADYFHEQAVASWETERKLPD